jgi:NADP-dependent 3-hydroxy acid dehydrogenase YdfG
MSGIQEKVVVITGASSGIGEATARLLARQGAHVVIGARRLERLEALASAIRSEGGSVVYHHLDVTELEQVQEIIHLAMSQFGRLDVVVNNAGVMPLSPLAALKIEEWNRMIDVNIRGVLHGIAQIRFTRHQGVRTDVVSRGA